MIWYEVSLAFFDAALDVEKWRGFLPLILPFI